MQLLNFLLLVVVIVLLVLNQKNFSIPILKKSRKRSLVLDSCTLIDGRIVQLAQSGLITDPIVVPYFIINELQLLADGSDTSKRNRARVGLDNIKKLQDIKTIKVIIDNTKIQSDGNKTDEKLIKIALQKDATLFTTDINLAKVAQLQQIIVINPNELSEIFRQKFLPGDIVSTEIMKKGTTKKQGIGYLDNGTLVVVEDGHEYIGKRIDVYVDQIRPTTSGTMLFGHSIMHQQYKNSNQSRLKNSIRNRINSK